jgi:hypothetical protein
MKHAKFIIVALVVALMGFYSLSSVNASNDPVNSGTVEVANQGGLCADGSEPVSTTWDFEDGAQGWTDEVVDFSETTGNFTYTWSLTTTNAPGSTGDSPSGGNYFYAVDFDGGGPNGDITGTLYDQYLVSPEFGVPTSGAADLSFWNLQAFEVSDGQCWDSGFIEVSADGGTTWDYTTITETAPFTVTPAYDVDIHDEYLGLYPYENALAYCSADFDPSGTYGWRDWAENTVDLSAYAGQTVQVRFHFFVDNLAGAYGWLVDDVSAEVCPAGPPTAVTLNTIASGSDLPIVPMVGAGLLALAAAGIVVRRFRK